MQKSSLGRQRRTRVMGRPSMLRFNLRGSSSRPVVARASTRSAVSAVGGDSAGATSAPARVSSQRVSGPTASHWRSPSSLAANVARSFGPTCPCTRLRAPASATTLARCRKRSPRSASRARPSNCKLCALMRAASACTASTARRTAVTSTTTTAAAAAAAAVAAAAAAASTSAATAAAGSSNPMR